MHELRIARSRAGMTLMELEAASGVGASTISKIERGVSQPQANTLHKLAEALGVEVGELYPKGSGRSSLEPTLLNGLEDERRLRYLKPWAGYVRALANRVEHEIDQGHATDLNWGEEFNRDVLTLTLLYNRILPPPAEQSEDERLELLKFGEAINHLNDVADKMDRAMEPVIAEQRKQYYAKERERRKAAFNAIPRRRSA